MACSRIYNKLYGNSELLVELNSIVSRFTSEQRRIAESTGFAAFAKPVHALPFDRQFTVWLLTKVDTLTKSIGTNCGKRLIVFAEDVAKNFGIPFAGKDVWDASLDKSQTMRDEIDSLIGMDEINTSPRAAARQTLIHLAGKDLDPQEEAKFTVSFIVYVTSILCDSRNPGERETSNYWPALKYPEKIHTFNWASLVLDSIWSACVSSKMHTRTNTYFSPPLGTALFLQVLSIFFFIRGIYT
jgi:hypothetical protein